MAYRATIHQVITRLGVDTLTDKIGSAKEDVRFREIEPESFVLGYPTPKEASVDAEIDGEAEAWFDWAFLDFWKSNYCNDMVFKRQFSRLIKIFPFRYCSEGRRRGSKLVCHRNLGC